MSWIIYALICALCLATVDALCKKTLTDDNSDPYIIALVRVGYAFPFTGSLLPFITIPRLDTTFFVASLSAAPLNVIAILLYIKAIKISPLSLTIPFLSLTPVFLLGTSYLILGETPGRMGLVGIILVVTGAYLLNVHTISRGALEPLRAIRNEKGSLLMIIVAFMFSICACIGKIAVQHSSPVFFSAASLFLLSLSMLLVASFRTKHSLSKVFSRPLLFLSIGALSAVSIIMHTNAISLVDVSYVISVKRLSIFFGVIYSVVLFKETNIKERIVGSAMMVSGVILICVF